MRKTIEEDNTEVNVLDTKLNSFNPQITSLAHINNISRRISFLALDKSFLQQSVGYYYNVLTIAGYNKDNSVHTKLH